MARQPKSGKPRERQNAEKTFYSSTFNPFQAKTENQKRYFNALSSYTIVFGIGPAGTGKTAVATSYAMQQLFYGKVDKVVLVRPIQEAAGEKLGFLPGDIDSKIADYLTPIREIGEQVLGKSMYEMFVKSGKITGVPLALCRGRTFNNAIVLFDESQNSNPEQMLMLLTRFGENSKVFITGDLKQTDIKGKNGLSDALKRLSYIPQVKIIEFDRSDIVRNGLIGEILQAYEND